MDRGQNTVTAAWDGIIAFFQGIPGKIVAALSALGGDLTSLGSTIMNDFLNGVKAVWTTVEGWFSGLPSAILKALGIASPPQWALDAGKHIMNGLLSSFAHGAADVKSFFVSLASDITGPLKAAWTTVTSAFAGGGAPAGSGVVAAWITAALNAAGEPMSWLPLLEILVGKESGGNPGAVNPISVMGEHASGLFQTLPSTYAEFATVAGGVFNPISDAVAGIRYIIATYGSPANIPGLHGGNYVGYASGGMITEPIAGYGVSSGQRYMFGERGSEMVTPVSSGGGGASISDVVNRLERLITVASQIPASTGHHVGSAIGGAAAAASFRGTVPPWRCS